MTSIFTSLTHAITAGPLVAGGAAFVWGVLSVVLSPCHLASIPLVVAYVHGQGGVSGRRAFVLSLTFALGILVTIAVIGAATAAAGRLLGDVGTVGNLAVAGVLFVVGLQLLGVLRLPGGGRGPWTPACRGVPGALLLGLAFGVALGPCTFAFLAPMLAVAFKVAASRPLVAGLLLLAYALGHGAVIVAAGVSTRHVQRFLDWRIRSLGSTLLRRACGGLIVVAGIYLVATAP